MAGLGPAPTAPDPDTYAKRHAHCEVLVVGGGNAGRAAAAAARGEGRVMLIDDRPPRTELDGVRVLTRTTAFGRYDDGLVMAIERLTDHLPLHERDGPRQRLWQIRAKRIVLATGAHQQPLVFPGNDLPGIMLSAAAVTYLEDFGVLVGSRIVVVGDGAGVEPLAAAGATLIRLPWIRCALGRRRVTGVVDADGRRHACDAVLMAGGWAPALHLHSHVGGKVRFDAGRHVFVPVAEAEQPQSVGACAGDVPVVVPVAPVNGPKAFVDFQNDVTITDIDLATREGFVSVEHLKRYTTTGMATDQGKLSNLNAMRRLADNRGDGHEVVGLTTFRPPYTPVTFGALAGRDRGLQIDATRFTPLHDWHVAHGAVFEDVGQWKRPRFYPRAGESMHDAVLREGRAVRRNVGLLDASTLGKIDIRGPDSARFLNLVYTNSWLKLEVGRCRYGVMLGEDGMVFDDGVTARIGDQHFIMFTTTGNAARVLDHLEDYLQTEWPHLDVFLTSVTEHWAAAVVTGPRARALLEMIVLDCDLAPVAFPHLSWRTGSVAGMPVRLYRISFTGELSFEIHVDARFAPRVWAALWDAGRAIDLTPYGTEAMHVLRAEKGYVIIGQETDGTVNPLDLDLGWAVPASKPDFVGKRSLARPEMLRDDRKQLVGLLPDKLLPEGTQISEMADANRSIGHVTSSYWSPVLDRPIALALLASGRSRHAQVVHARFDGATVPAQVTAPLFHDPDGLRLNG